MGNCRGYFGCRTPDGKFDAEKFKQQAELPQIKMIEIKLSQGAKPGHGGILPKHKITEEIAQIRGVSRDQDCISPPKHSAFNTPIEMMHFIQQLRELSGGKPVGFKLCIGQPWQFMGIVKAMPKPKLCQTLLWWMALKAVQVRHRSNLVIILVHRSEKAFYLCTIP